MKKHYEAVRGDILTRFKNTDSGYGELTHRETVLLNIAVSVLREVGSSVSSDAHTREVAEKAFEAARTISLKDYNPDLKIGEHPLKYKSFEDYLNSLNPEGK